MASALNIVATTSILGDIVGEIVGDDVNVEVLIPNGSDPHAFEPSPGNVASLQEADLVVANGLGLEESLGAVLEDAERDGVTVLEVAPAVDPIEFQGEHSHEDEEAAGLDPHFWTDPVRVAQATEVIATALSEIDDSVDWDTRAQRYADAVTEAHEEVEAKLEPIPADRRKLITNHEVFGYFAERYGFEVVGAVIPGGSTLAEPSAGDLAELASLINAEGVAAIFAETTQPEDLVNALRREADAEVAVVTLYTEALGEQGSGAETYLGMIATNAERIASALVP